MYKEENIVIGAGTSFFGGRILGWTKDALTIGQNVEKKIIDDVQQVGPPVAIRRVKAGHFVIKMNLYEFTLENIRLAWGINSTITYGTSLKQLLLNVSGSFHEGELRIEAQGPDGVSRTYVWYLCVLTECGDVSHDAKEPSILSVTFESIKHPSYVQVGKIEEEYVPSPIVVD